eukprot:IDg6191t1
MEDDFRAGDGRPASPDVGQAGAHTGAYYAPRRGGAAQPTPPLVIGDPYAPVNPYAQPYPGGYAQPGYVRDPYTPEPAPVPSAAPAPTGHGNWRNRRSQERSRGSHRHRAERHARADDGRGLSQILPGQVLAKT